jgi:hypothetical protein
MVNTVEVTAETTPETLVASLGEASRVETSSAGEKAYIYDAMGFMFIVKDSKVKGVGINYNWDGDVKFPKTSFTGSLSLGELSITKETSSAEISAIQNVEFLCPIPSMCMTKDREIEIKCMVAYYESKLSQVVFLIG